MGARYLARPAPSGRPQRRRFAVRLFPTMARLTEEGDPLEPPDGIVYSTGPRKALASDGNIYAVKNHGSGIVLAEAVCYVSPTPL